MKQRNVLVTVPYYNYAPHRIIIGIRPAPQHDIREAPSILNDLHHKMPGWASLSLCDQQPVGLIRCNKLRVLASMPGTIDPYALDPDALSFDVGCV